jgi:S-adenosylmethionine synthetase
MPMPILYAHKLVEKLAEQRKSGAVDFLRPDAKSQVSVRYVDGRPRSVAAVVVSTQHAAAIGNDRLHEYVTEEIIKPVIPAELRDPNWKLYINPTGRFVIGGPHGDAGLTGRKIIVDTYGGAAHHGGGAFSGKDPTKVDRSAHYAARYVAKNIVAAGLASRCEIQVAYAIGVAEPVSIMVDTFGTGKLPDERLATIVAEVAPLKPAQIIDHLRLRRPIYQPTAAYGHFGRELPDFTWEARDLVDALRRAAG